MSYEDINLLIMHSIKERYKKKKEELDNARYKILNPTNAISKSYWTGVFDILTHEVEYLERLIGIEKGFTNEHS